MRGSGGTVWGGSLNLVCGGFQAAWALRRIDAAAGIGLRLFRLPNAGGRRQPHRPQSQRFVQMDVAGV